MTNYQKIKEMSIEEMAKFILDIYYDGWADGVEYEVEKPEYLQWLESEVGENRKTEKLKRCPFCGERAEMIKYIPHLWIIRCTKCKGTVERSGETEKEARERWNRRSNIK